MFKKTQIIKSKKHLEYIARNYPCLICRSNWTVQACHIRHTDKQGNAGWGTKGGDMYVVPLCYLCHQKQHEQNEFTFWINNNINPIEIAYKISLKSPISKIKQLAKEGFYNEAINYYRDRQESAKSIIRSKDL